MPLIGFAGAPFTVASYLIEGGRRGPTARTKALMHGEPALWYAADGPAGRPGARLAASQVEAGASAVQLFDSWAGALSPPTTSASCCPPARRCSPALADLGVPRIHFGVGTGELLGLMATAGADVVGRRLARAARRGPRAGSATTSRCRATSTPPSCLAPWQVVAAEVARRAARNGGHPGTSSTSATACCPRLDPAVLEQVVELVHARARADGPTGARPTRPPSAWS